MLHKKYHKFWKLVSMIQARLCSRKVREFLNVIIRGNQTSENTNENTYDIQMIAFRDKNSVVLKYTQIR